MGLKTFSEEYFENLNPLAKKIIEEIVHTRDSYENLWKNLSLSEQRQIVDETIIRPEVVLKYSSKNQNNLSDDDEVDVYPCFKVQSGAKYVVYEDVNTGQGVRWRDEHSAPFSWLTRSQQDLRIFTTQDNTTKMSKSSTPVRKSRGNKGQAPPVPSLTLAPMDPPSLVLGGSSGNLASSPNKQTILNKLISKTAVLKLPFSVNNGHSSINVPESENLISAAGKRATILKPKLPPPPPPSTTKNNTDEIKPPPLPLAEIHKAASAIKARNADREDQILERKSNKVERKQDNKSEEGLPLLPSETNNQTKVIPKTGFEFLDNW